MNPMEWCIEKTMDYAFCRDLNFMYYKSDDMTTMFVGIALLLVMIIFLVLYSAHLENKLKSLRSAVKEKDFAEVKAILGVK